MRKLSAPDLLSSYIVEPSGCHRWTRNIGSKGYGTLNWQGKTWRAHRWFYTHRHGPIPEGMVVRHMCHNPSCVNLDHLRLGTQLDNMRDCVEAGRHARGEKVAKNKRGRANPSAHLTESAVRYIREQVALGRTRKAIACELGVHRITVGDACRGRTWAWIEPQKASG